MAAMNGHFVSIGDEPVAKDFEHGIQVIDDDKTFTPHLNDYLQKTDVYKAGFNYHLISVFGAQSTGKSTLLNLLFNTKFSVMSDTERRQTTKGVWMSKNKRTADDGSAVMADNILVMDVEGSDGRERWEDQDFERKSALFALATSEVLIINIWEHQVGLYHGANMVLLRTVFDVNLELFLKDRHSNPRSLIFFVIRDFIGNTPLSNLRNTIVQDLHKTWSSISKPPGLETSSIDDFFDFGFAALPHKILQPDKFTAEVENLGRRFVVGDRSKTTASEQEYSGGIFLPEYHRRIPADGFSIYAEGVWDQIVNNKDLNLPSQQEALSRARCDEITIEAIDLFDEQIAPIEQQLNDALRSGKPVTLSDVAEAGAAARVACLSLFKTQASRYQKSIYVKKLAELEKAVDKRLKDLDEDCARLRKEEMRRLATIIERGVKLRLDDAVGLVFNNLGSGRAISTGDAIGSAVPESATNASSDEAAGSSVPSEKDLWDRIWATFVTVSDDAQYRFKLQSKDFDASEEEVAAGLWRLRRKSWIALREKIEEIMKGSILPKLEENFKHKFRYDDAGVPRIWRANDDIEGVYTRARDSTLALLPILSRFRLASTYASPELPAWIGEQPAGVLPEGEDGLPPIGGVDLDGGRTLEDEMTVLSEGKRQDLAIRFKQAADDVYFEAKRGALGGITQVPMYFYGILLLLGWNELVAILRNPFLFLLLAILGGGTYVAYTLSLLGPMMQMANAASNQAVEIGKQKLREFLENNDTARQALAMPPRAGLEASSSNSSSDNISLDTLDASGRKQSSQE